MIQPNIGKGINSFKRKAEEKHILCLKKYIFIFYYESYEKNSEARDLEEVKREQSVSNTVHNSHWEVSVV